MKNIIKILASFCYLGYIPFIPGTTASLAGVGLYFLFRGNLYLYTSLLLVICGLGLLTAGRAEKIFQQRDSNKIVIDEVAGVLLAFWGLSPKPILIVAGFFIFRALDIFKIYPANRIEQMQGSPGIMGDDLIAGVYTNIILRLASRIFLL